MKSDLSDELKAEQIEHFVNSGFNSKGSVLPEQESFDHSPPTSDEKKVLATA